MVHHLPLRHVGQEVRYAYLPGSLTAPENRCGTCGTPNTAPAVPVIETPLVHARFTLSLEEIADGRGQAMSTGALAVEHGWTVEPLYYLRADDVQVSVLRMWHRARGRVLFVEWTRSESAWSAGGALSWRIGVADTMLRCNVTVARALLAREPA